MSAKGIMGLLLGAFIFAAIIAPQSMAEPIIALVMAVIAFSTPMKKNL